MAHTYFKNEFLTVTSDGVNTSQHYYKLAELGPTRSLTRRTKSIVAVDIVSNTGTVIESVLFTNRDTEALNAVNAINEALAQTPTKQTHTAGYTVSPVSVSMPPAKERDALSWIGILVGAALTALVVFWLLSVIF